MPVRLWVQKHLLEYVEQYVELAKQVTKPPVGFFGIIIIKLICNLASYHSNYENLENNLTRVI